MKNEKMENIKNYIIKNGGITLDTQTLENTTIKKGYSVSLQGYEEIKNNIEDTLKIVKNYIKEVEQLKQKNIFVGVWYDIKSQLYYIDLSIIVNDKRKAEQLARKNKQLAIYDLKNNNSIYLNYNITYYSLYKKVYKNNKLVDEVNLNDFDTLKDISNYLTLSYRQIKNIFEKKENYYYTIIKSKININEL